MDMVHDLDSLVRSIKDEGNRILDELLECGSLPAEDEILTA